MPWSLAPAVEFMQDNLKVVKMIQGKPIEEQPTRLEALKQALEGHPHVAPAGIAVADAPAARPVDRLIDGGVPGGGESRVERGASRLTSRRPES